MHFVGGPNTHITNLGGQLGKIEKSPYLSNGLTDRHEIWDGDAVWPL